MHIESAHNQARQTLWHLSYPDEMIICVSIVCLRLYVCLCISLKYFNLKREMRLSNTHLYINLLLCRLVCRRLLVTMPSWERIWQGKIWKQIYCYLLFPLIPDHFFLRSLSVLFFSCLFSSSLFGCRCCCLK